MLDTYQGRAPRTGCGWAFHCVVLGGQSGWDRPRGVDMGSFSIWHWLIVIVFILVVAVPCAKILNKAGRSRWWLILALFPYINLIALWVFAYTRWPALDPTPDKDSN